MPSVGLMFFSVGAAGAALVGDVVVVVVVVVVDVGDCCPLEPHAATAPIAMTDDATAMAIRRRSIRPILMCCPILLERPSDQLRRWTPGGSVGAAGAMTCGEKRLPPVGLMPFSVGAGGAALDGGAVVVVVVVVVDVDGGAFSLPVPQPAASSPNVRTAAPPATTLKRRFDQYALITSQLARCVLCTS